MSERLHIAIVCFPTVGGSGVVATEIALAMAERGHSVHVVAKDVPVRLHARAGVVFHEVPGVDHPVLPGGAGYPIELAAKLVEVASFHRIDVIHAHYAVPHSIAAWMAHEVLAKEAGAAPRVVHTLHGTDVTVLAADPSYRPMVRVALTGSAAVTAPSRYLEAQGRSLGFGTIEVIPNFVDTARFAPVDRGGPHDELVVLHVSNFRKVKRVTDVISIFAEVSKSRRARLVLIGDGPERGNAERRLRDLGLHDRASLLGKQDDFVGELANADVFLLPSESESFGLAALEALSCGVPVVASDVGGVPEVVEHGVSGLLAPVGDVAAMAAHVLSLGDGARWRSYSSAARARAAARFKKQPAIDQYELLYRRALST